ncbi:hypothetical protein BGX38DRAFT_612992 [Terfezia claveryi]|nr:hypothetical protein BGX38DRAFT_612992 [Terfezia claveryi]
MATLAHDTLGPTPLPNLPSTYFLPSTPHQIQPLPHLVASKFNAAICQLKPLRSRWQEQQGEVGFLFLLASMTLTSTMPLLCQVQGCPRQCFTGTISEVTHENPTKEVDLQANYNEQLKPPSITWGSVCSYGLLPVRAHLTRLGLSLRKTSQPDLPRILLLRPSPSSTTSSYCPCPPNSPISVRFPHHADRLALRGCLSRHVFHTFGKSGL